MPVNQPKPGRAVRRRGCRSRVNVHGGEPASPATNARPTRWTTRVQCSCAAQSTLGITGSGIGYTTEKPKKHPQIVQTSHFSSTPLARAARSLLAGRRYQITLTHNCSRARLLIRWRHSRNGAYVNCSLPATTVLRPGVTSSSKLAASESDHDPLAACLSSRRGPTALRGGVTKGASHGTEAFPFAKRPRSSS